MSERIKNKLSSYVVSFFLVFLGIGYHNSMAQSLQYKSMKVEAFEVPRISKDSSYVDVYISEEIPLKFDTNMGTPVVRDPKSENGFTMYRMVFYPETGANRWILSVMADGFEPVKIKGVQLNGKDMKRYRISSDRVLENENLVEGEKLYNEGNYAEAKEYFLKASNDSSVKSKADGWIRLCDQYIVNNFRTVPKNEELVSESNTITSPKSDYLEQGLLAYTKQEYTKAYDLFSLAYDSNDLRSASLIGVMLQQGLGTTQNENAAIPFFKAGAEYGDPQAQFDLATLLFQGKFLKRDIKEAFHLLQLSASKGHAYSQLTLGLFYSKGKKLGLSESQEEAFRWVEKSAKQQNAHAQYRLGIMYELGRGTSKDLDLASKWYSESAQYGYEPAMIKVASLSKTQ